MAWTDGWLERLIRTEAGADARPLAKQAWAQASALERPRARARLYVKRVQRESGLVYGTPATASDGAASAEERLFEAVLRAFCRMALDVFALAGAPRDGAAERLLACFLALNDELDAAADVFGRVGAKAGPSQRRWRTAEQRLEERVLSLAADPYYGLVLHNGAVYADAHAFGRIATALALGHKFPRDEVARAVGFLARQKAQLVRVLVGLVCAERKPSFPTRRAVLRQIDDLRLPAALADETTEFARRAFERSPPLSVLLGDVRSRDAKRFLVEQTVLASLVDGRRSEREQQWTRTLGSQLGFDERAMHALELDMAEFYARHRDVVDVFTLAQGAEVLGEELVDDMSRAVRKNSRALMKEIRETGELSVLLARAARGQKLSADDKRKMREQLIDVAKAVPALAIFAAPGGVLLLIALAKVMKFDMLPSAFREDEAGER